MGRYGLRWLFLTAITLVGHACAPGGQSHPTSEEASVESHMFLGLGTVIYQVRDLTAAKAWYSDAFGMKPYFDQPYYVGFNVGGYELGLSPDSSITGPGAGGSVAYWRVSNIGDAVSRLAGRGAAIVSPIQDVGDGIMVVTMSDPDGNLIGLIENRHFRLPE